MLQSFCKSLRASVACIYWKEWMQKAQSVNRIFISFNKNALSLIFFPPSINTVLCSKKSGCYQEFFLWIYQRKETPACSSCCTTLAFLSSTAFPPQENSALPRQLNWSDLCSLCKEKRLCCFVRFQGRHGNTGGEKQLGWDMGTTILSLNLRAYDQTGLTLHLLPDYRVYGAAVWKQKAVNQSNGQLPKGAGGACDAMFSFGSLSGCSRHQNLSLHISACTWAYKYNSTF